MTRIAVLADIHGNLPALEAVLAEVNRLGVEHIIVNGDFADGPCPAETLDRLFGLGDRLLGLRGNGDRWLVEAFDGTYRPRGAEPDDLILWAATQITRAHRDALAALPLTHIVDHPDLGPLGFCHATARSDNEMILVDAALDHARDALAALDTPTIFLGHSHMPFDRLFDRRRVINTGSVGMPYGHAGASWVLIDRDIGLRRTLYDVETAAAGIAASSMPDLRNFINSYVRSSFSDREALEAFRSVMERQQAAGRFD